jgi:hypothetical protein
MAAGENLEAAPTFPTTRGQTGAILDKRNHDEGYEQNRSH